MSEKNSDIERAISAFGGGAITYHSFGPFAIRPRVSADAQPFLYNEFGEAEYVPAVVAAPLIVPSASPPADPLYDELPIVQAPLPPSRQASSFKAAPQATSSRPMPPIPAQVSSRAAPRPVLRPMPVSAAPTDNHEPYRAPAARVEAALPQQPVMPPPPPFFPLLAAALPNATEPSYMPSYPVAVQPGRAPSPAMAGVAPAKADDMRGSVGSREAGVTFEPVEQADRRSLADMFRLLSGRTDMPPVVAKPGVSGSVPTSDLPPVESQALFRRI